MIDILIPVLGRPQNAQPLVDSIRANTRTEHHILFLCSRGDDGQIDACRATGEQTTVVGWTPGVGDYARKINHGAMITDAWHRDWLFLGADDISFERNWDITALKIAGDYHHVIATNDLANANVRRGMFGTHCLVRRRYITETGGTVDGGPGSLLHEGYDHNFVDRELCHSAQHRQRFVFARHSRVPHRHPGWRTATNDDTYRKGAARFRQDHQLFLSRAHLWDYVGLSGNERRHAP